MHVSITSVTAVGRVNAVYDRCTFRIKTSVIKSTTLKCKESIIPKIREIDKVIKDFGFVSPGSHKASSEVEPEKQYNSKTNRHESVGYRYTHIVTFRINDVSKVNDVMDALTSINDVEMDSPVFSIKNDNDLKTQAMQLGFDLAKKNFAGQCTMAGEDLSDYELVSWEVRDGVSREFTKTSMPEVFSPLWEVDSMVAPEIIKPGAADVSVSVTLKYASTLE